MPFPWMTRVGAALDGEEIILREQDSGDGQKKWLRFVPAIKDEQINQHNGKLRLQQEKL